MSPPFHFSSVSASFYFRYFFRCSAPCARSSFYLSPFLYMAGVGVQTLRDRRFSKPLGPVPAETVPLTPTLILTLTASIALTTRVIALRCGRKSKRSSYAFQQYQQGSTDIVRKDTAFCAAKHRVDVPYNAHHAADVLIMEQDISEYL